MNAVVLSLLLASPETLTARVVSIHDGDTITVLAADKTQHKIRLASIDAPELKQAFGTRAREALGKLVAEKDVRIVWKEKDRYGRILGDVYVGDVWVNREMINRGLAWHYTRFDRRPELRDAELDAVEAERGLWSGPAIPPWAWRKK